MNGKKNIEKCEKKIPIVLIVWWIRSKLRFMIHDYYFFFLVSGTVLRMCHHLHTQKNVMKNPVYAFRYIFSIQTVNQIDWFLRKIITSTFYVLRQVYWFRAYVLQVYFGDLLSKLWVLTGYKKGSRFTGTKLMKWWQK